MRRYLLSLAIIISASSHVFANDNQFLINQFCSLVQKGHYDIDLDGRTTFSDAWTILVALDNNVTTYPDELLAALKALDEKSKILGYQNLQTYLEDILVKNAVIVQDNRPIGVYFLLEFLNGRLKCSKEIDTGTKVDAKIGEIEL